jgi:Rhodopirellula transposase DDE domain
VATAGGQGAGLGVISGAQSPRCSGYRLRLWKLELQRLADETGLEITICLFPPGTSKWTRSSTAVERDQPAGGARALVSHEVVVKLVAATTTRTGPRVRSGSRRRPIQPAGSYPTPKWRPCISDPTPSTANGITRCSPPHAPSEMSGPIPWLSPTARLLDGTNSMAYRECVPSLRR